MLTVQDQIKREQDDVKRAVQRYLEFRKAAPEADTPPGRRFVSMAMEKLVPAIQKAQRDFLKKRSLANDLPLYINTLSAPKLAVLTIRHALYRDRYSRQFSRSKHNLARHAVQLSTTVRHEYELDLMRKEAPDLFYMMTRRLRNMTPKKTSQWRRRCRAVAENPWTREDMVKLGVRLLGLLVQVCPEWFEETSAIHKGKTITTIGLTAAARALLDAEHDQCQFNFYTAMIYPPKPWRTSSSQGGYYTYARPSPVKETVATDIRDARVPEQICTALNSLQDVPWAINTEIYTAARIALEEETPVGYFRDGLIDLPPRVPADQWKQMDEAARTTHKQLLAPIHSHNHRVLSRLDIVRRQLELASDYQKYDQIYFPYEIDFRGRLYPMPLDLHPQANDMGRALLRFAETKPLGDHGIYWLFIHAANCYGEDKLALGERFEWTKSNLAQIEAFANAPFDFLRFWQEADKPWQFLAAALEIREAMLWPEGIREFPSSLPVDVDGTCNGLQHLSALGHDTQAAAAVNMLPGARQDIYQIIADLVSGIVPPESPWYSQTSRAVVKRAVMTTPYGVTDIGIRDQLLEDRFVEELGIDRNKHIAAANEMRDLIKTVLDESLNTPRRIMNWFQDVAAIFAELDEPLVWTTPTGLWVSQAYRRPKYQTIRTMAGDGQYRRVKVRRSISKAQPIAKRKQLNAAAPNIIHSFDAAHLVKTALGFTAAVPGAAFSPVHDSFGTHACDVPKLNEVIREEFVKMYRSNWLLALHYEWKLRADELGVGIPPAPEQGDLDIEKVLDSTYFFS